MPPCTTRHSLRSRYQAEPIQQDPNDPSEAINYRAGPINDHSGPINSQAGMAPNAPSTPYPEDNAQCAPEEITQSIGQMVNANMADSEGILLMMLFECETVVIERKLRE
jgi:hypothetical protein